MTDWKQQIEAQIAKLIEGEDQCLGCLADTMQALLDVAVAVDEYEGTSEDALIKAFDKLREVVDE